MIRIFQRREPDGTVNHLRFRMTASASFVAFAITGLLSTDPSKSLTVHLIRRCPAMADCLSPGIVRRMIHETSHIWSSLDVRIEWIDPVDAARAATRVDLKVMLEEADDSKLHRGVRGLVLAAIHQPDAPCGPGLARVWVTHVRRHAALIRFQAFQVASLPDTLADLFIARALGRALAHEIGHYLLGTARHTSHGLMRARFTPQELVEPASEARYGLDRRDRAALRSCRSAGSLALTSSH
jgi:hypothetical protein